MSRLLGCLLGIVWVTLVAGCGRPLRLQCAPGATATRSYRFTSTRQIDILWGLTGDPADTNERSTITETLTYVMDYHTEPGPEAGSTRVTASCREARVRRSNSAGALAIRRPDAAEALAGQSFTVVLAEDGQWLQAAELTELLRRLARSAFRAAPSGGGRVKDPEMIYDVAVGQWFLFDVVRSYRVAGVTSNHWSSVQLLPSPMVMRQGRRIDYHLERVTSTATGRTAEVRSTCRLADEPLPGNWPVAYGGRFQVAGTFGFLQGYRSEALDGEGLDVIELETGWPVRSEHRYQWRLRVGALPLTTVPAQPRLVITQTLAVERL